MRFEVRRWGIEIRPENPQDEAYVEDTLGLRKDGDSIKLVRVNAMSLSCLGHLYAEPERIPKSVVSPASSDEENACG